MISKSEILGGKNKFHIIAKEPFLVMDAIGVIRKAVPEYEVRIFRTLDSFLESCHRGALFDSEPKILVLWEMTQESLPSIQNILTLTEDVLVLVERKTLTKNKAYTQIKGDCFTITLSPPDEKECEGWVKDKLRALGVDYDPGVPSELVRRRGYSLGVLERETRKLSLIYKGNKFRVEDLDMVPDTADFKVYKFVEDFLHRRYVKAFNHLDKLDKNSYVKVSFTLVDNLVRLLNILSIKESGKSLEDVSDLTGINKYILKTKYYTILSVMGRNRIIKMVDTFNQMDNDLRTSSYPKDLVIQAYLVKASKV